MSPLIGIGRVEAMLLGITLKRRNLWTKPLAWGLSATLFLAIVAHATTPPSDKITDQATDKTGKDKASNCSSLLVAKPQLTSKQKQTLELIGQRYKNADSQKVQFTPNGEYPVLIHGFGEKHALPQIDWKNPIIDPEVNDVTIMGGGPAGLITALYTTDKKLKVRLLERSNRLGGLGAGAADADVESGIGSAYSSGPEGPFEHAIYRHIGLSTLKTKLKIPSPIDSFLLNGKIYEGFWESEEVLKELPTSFEVFKHVLEWSAKKGLTAIDEPAGQSLDALTTEQWVKQMPQILSRMKDKHSRDLFDRFNTDPRIDRSNPMRTVLDLLDLYSRSALGEPTRVVSALAFADFYISELDTRYTGTLGTGTITQAIVKRLEEKDRKLQVQTGANVLKVENHENYVDIYYLLDRKLHRTRSKYFVFSGPVKMAPKIIENFAQLAPERVPMIENLEMTHYLVHVLRLKGHPFRATFDLWSRDEKYTHDGALPDPTDFILGRWVDPKIKGYAGLRDFKKDPEDDRGILTVYHPLGRYAVGKGLTREDVLKLSEHAVKRTKEMLNPLLKAKWGTELEVELVETYRWPNSIHVIKPGYLLNTKTLSKPIDRIFFANNTLHTPEIEDSMKQGRYAADEVIERYKRDKKNPGRD